MYEIYKAENVSLHVRKSNKAAISLYKDSLGFHVAKVEVKYCTSHFLHPQYATYDTHQTAMARMLFLCNSI